MGILYASLFTEDVVKFAIGVAFITLVVFIVWLLLREMRLWYWKVNNILKALQHLDKRISRLESMMDCLMQQMDTSNQNSMKISDLLGKSVLNPNQHQVLHTDNKEDDEEEIARKIKE